MPSFQKEGFQSSMPEVAQMSRPEAAMRGPGMTPSLTMSRIVTSIRCSAPGARDARVAAAQRELGVLDRVDRRPLRRELEVEVGQLAHAPERDVEVPLDQPGHERLALEVDHAHVAVRALAEVGRLADRR